jgi:hypothetical protein
MRLFPGIHPSNLGQRDGEIKAAPRVQAYATSASTARSETLRTQLATRS